MENWQSPSRVGDIMSLENGHIPSWVGGKKSLENGKSPQLEVKSPWQMYKDYSYELHEFENEKWNFRPSNTFHVKLNIAYL